MHDYNENRREPYCYVSMKVHRNGIHPYQPDHAYHFIHNHLTEIDCNLTCDSI